MKSCKCGCHENEKSCTTPIPITCPNTQTKKNLDLEICNLQSEIDERLQNMPDFSQLEALFIQLENDVQNLSEEKLQIEYELRQKRKEDDKSISELKTENDNLINEINNKGLMIEKLYLDNKELYSTLDSKIKDNENLKEQLIKQNDVLKNVYDDKKNLENNLENLNILKNQDYSDIQELKAQIDFLTKENINNDLELNKLNEINNQCIDELNEEENINIKLKQVLKEKDDEIKQNTHELELTNDTLKRLGNDFNNLNIDNNQEEEHINIMDENLIKESQLKEEIIRKNQQLSELINEKDCEIEELNNQNILENNNLNNINKGISSLDNKIEQYKQHIIHLTDMNELLSKELIGIIDIDEQMRNNAFNRIQYLKGLKEDNKNIINQSLKNLTTYMQNNGNKGCYIKAENVNDSNENTNNDNKNRKEINNNEFYSLKDNNNNNDEEEQENFEENCNDDE